MRNAIKSYDKANPRALSPTEPELKQTRHDISMRDGYKTSAWVLQSNAEAGAAFARPLIVLFHGGGFTIGTAGHMIPYARGLVQLFDAVVVSTTYRLASEHRFPYGPIDAWDALRWAATNARSLGADPHSGFIIGGISAGGNLACVLTQQAKDQKLDPLLTGSWICAPLIRPVEDSSPMNFAREQNAKAPILSTAEVDVLDEYYAADRSSPWYSPFNSKEAHIGLPPAYFQICGGDPMRDNGLTLYQALQEADVKSRLDVYPGMPHGFWTTFPQFRGSKLFMKDLAEGFGWLLGRDFDAQFVDRVLYLSIHES